MTSAILFKLEKGTRRRNCIRSIYLEIVGTKYVNEYTDWLLAEAGAKNILIVAPRSAIKHNVGVEVMFALSDREDMKLILDKIRSKEKIVFAIESSGKDTQRN